MRTTNILLVILIVLLGWIGTNVQLMKSDVTDTITKDNAMTVSGPLSEKLNQQQTEPMSGDNSDATRARWIPQKLSQNQIEAMTSDEIRQQLVKVSQARKPARGNKEIETQLDEQFKMLMDQLKARAQARGSATSTQPSNEPPPPVDN